MSPKLYWSEHEERVIISQFGALSPQAINSKPKKILLIFDQRKIDKLIAADWLDYKWSERKMAYEELNQLNFRSGNTYQKIDLVKNKMRLDMYDWLVEFEYFKEMSKTIVTTTRMEKAEKIISNFLFEKNKIKNKFYNQDNVNMYLDEFERENFKLSTEQRESVHMGVKWQLSFINGSAGSGKTTALKALLFVFNKIGITFQGMSPTGKAAKRLSVVSGEKAVTIHSFLRVKTPEEHEAEDGVADVPWDMEGAEEDPSIVKWVCRYAVVDEASMLSLPLLAQLIERDAVESFVFVGDDKQLPPVEPGNFLDLILRSNDFNAVRLNTIKRQLEDSNILKVANNVINNSPDLIQWDGKEDVEFMHSTQFGVEKVVERYVEDYKTFGPSEVVLLTPMKKGAMGTYALNKLIRDKVNPPKSSKKEIENFDTIFRVGDLVMNTKNKYMHNKAQDDFYVPNGEIGIIREAFMAGRKKVLVIEFDEHKLYCEANNVGDIVHAYALTVHKSQGSEYQRVYLIVHQCHNFMLKENMLYTGITRAKGKLTVYGNIFIFNRASVRADSKLRKSLFYPLYRKKVSKDARLSNDKN